MSNKFLKGKTLLLLLQMINAQIIFQQSFQEVQEQEIKNFLPFNYVLEENKAIFITLSQDDESTYPILEVCTLRNCIRDQNSIDFKQKIQYIRIEFANSNQLAYVNYNFLPFIQEEYRIRVKSLNNTSSYTILVEINDKQICYRPCLNNSTCLNGICHCLLGYLGYDCSLQMINIQSTNNLTTQKIYYFPYINCDQNQDYIYYLSEQSKITYSCSAKNPNLLEYDYFLGQNYLNISQKLMQNCQQFYSQLQTTAISSYIIIRLLQPDQVFLIKEYTTSTQSLNELGILLACIGASTLLALAFCVRKCRKDTKKKREKYLKEKKEKELLNQCLPSFEYQQLIIKHPVLKDDLECQICLIQFQPTSQVRLTYCTHIFHNQCIEEWLVKHKTCPMCRELLEARPFSSNNFLQTHAHSNQRTKSIHLSVDILHTNHLSPRLLSNKQTPYLEEIHHRIDVQQPKRKESSIIDESAANHPYQ